MKLNLITNGRDCCCVIKIGLCHSKVAQKWHILIVRILKSFYNVFERRIYEI